QMKDPETKTPEKTPDTEPGLPDLFPAACLQAPSPDHPSSHRGPGPASLAPYPESSPEFWFPDLSFVPVLSPVSLAAKGALDLAMLDRVMPARSSPELYWLVLYWLVLYSTALSLPVR